MRDDPPHHPPFRVGHAFDLHRLAPLASASGIRPLVLAGVALPSEMGVVAHSDGDALAHGVTDALLGAIGAPDIGQLFPDSDQAWDNADSMAMLRAACERVDERGYRVGNLDATVILERPRISPHKEEIRGNLARTLGVDASLVNVKGTSHEGVDAIGRGEALSVHAVVMLIAKERA